MKSLIMALGIVLVVSVVRAQDTTPPPAPTPQTTQVVFPAPSTDITALVVLFATALGGAIAKGFWDGFQRRRDRQEAADQKRRDDEAAAAAAQAKAAKNAVLDAKLDTALSTATANVRMNAQHLRRIADLTHDPQDIEAAELAEKLLAERGP